MAIFNRNDVVDELEALVDKYTLATVLDVLAEVASAKADHVETNWQDSQLAKAWDLNAAKLLNASAFAHKLAL